MIIAEKPISVDELRELAKTFFGNMIKGVVDVELGVLAIDAELHSDLEEALLEQGSRQQHLWGINLYPDMSDADFVEFDSLINIRPSQNNLTRGVADEKTRQAIISIVDKWVEK